LGFALAELVHIPVTPWGFAALPRTSFPVFCSDYQDRGHAHDLLEAKRVTNPNIIADVVVFDVWVGNDDRNLGGFVGRIPETAARGNVELLAIDFEQSHVLRGESPLRLNERPSHSFLPRVEIRRYIPRGQNALGPMLHRIEAISKERLEEAFDRLVFPADGFLQSVALPRADDTIRHLLARAQRIENLVSEVFHGAS
jgi:hypothetical protein